MYPKIEYICFTSINGYGIAAYNYVRSLSNFDVSVSPLDFKKSRKNSWDFDSYLKEDDPERVQIFHCNPTMQKRHPIYNERKIGFATFETFDPPDYWIEILNRNDAVITPSKFCQQEFKKAGVHVPIHYIQHCIDGDLYHPIENFNKQFDKFTFLFIGAWKKRKGYDLLLQAWEKEFKASEPVRLVIKTNRGPAAKHFCKQFVKSAEIEIIDKFIPEQEMPDFMRAADCVILPTRGEGFGSPGLQALSLGIPLITPSHSGCTEYTELGMTYNIPIRGYEKVVEMDQINQFSNRVWADIDVSEICKAMRDVYEDRETYRTQVIKNNKLLSKFSYKSVGERFKEIFSPENS